MSTNWPTYKQTPGIQLKQVWHYDSTPTYTNGIQLESFLPWPNPNTQPNHTSIGKNASTSTSSNTLRKVRLGVMPWVLIRNCKFSTRKMSSISPNLRGPNVRWQLSTRRSPRVISWYRSISRLPTRVWVSHQVYEIRILCLKVHLLNGHLLSRIECKSNTLLHKSLPQAVTSTMWKANSC